MRFAVVISCITLLFSCGLMQSKDAQTVLKAKSLIESNKAQSAVALLENFIRDNPHSPKSLVFLLEIKINRKEVESAKGLLDKLIAENPKDKAFLEYMTSRFLFESKNFEDAWSAAYRAVQLNPKSVLYTGFKAFIAANTGITDETEAATLAKAAVKLGKKDPIALFSLSVSDFYAGNEADGKKSLELAAKNATGNYLALRSCGLLYSALGMETEAEEMFNKLIALDDHNAASFAIRGSHYITATQAVKAIADYDKALELDPQNKDYFLSSGNAYYSALEFEKAESIFLEALKRWPDEPSALYNMAFVKFYQHDLIEARKYTDRCIELGIELDQRFIDSLKEQETLTDDILEGMRAVN